MSFLLKNCNKSSLKITISSYKNFKDLLKRLTWRSRVLKKLQWRKEGLGSLRWKIKVHLSFCEGKWNEKINLKLNEAHTYYHNPLSFFFKVTLFLLGSFDFDQNLWRWSFILSAGKFSRIKWKHLKIEQRCIFEIENIQISL